MMTLQIDQTTRALMKAKGANFGVAIRRRERDSQKHAMDIAGIVAMLDLGLFTVMFSGEDWDNPCMSVVWLAEARHASRVADRFPETALFELP